MANAIVEQVECLSQDDQMEVEEPPSIVDVRPMDRNGRTTVIVETLHPPGPDSMDESQLSTGTIEIIESSKHGDTLNFSSIDDVEDDDDDDVPDNETPPSTISTEKIKTQQTNTQKLKNSKAHKKINKEQNKINYYKKLNRKNKNEHKKNSLITHQKLTQSEMIYYRLKRKLKYLIYENEFFKETLKQNQKKLLKTIRDRTFLLDRLVFYEEKPSGPTIPSDDDLTQPSTDDENVAMENETRHRMKLCGINMKPRKKSAMELPPRRKRYIKKVKKSKLSNNNKIVMTSSDDSDSCTVYSRSRSRSRSITYTSSGRATADSSSLATTTDNSASDHNESINTIRMANKRKLDGIHKSTSSNAKLDNITSAANTAMHQQLTKRNNQKVFVQRISNKNRNIGKNNIIVFDRSTLLNNNNHNDKAVDTVMTISSEIVNLNSHNAILEYNNGDDLETEIVFNDDELNDTIYNGKEANDNAAEVETVNEIANAIDIEPLLMETVSNAQLTQNITHEECTTNEDINVEE